MKIQNSDFWKEKYDLQKTGWDLGEISTPLKEYFDQLTNKNVKILIPGAGNSYEAEYLHNQGFKKVIVIDWVQEVLDRFKKRVSSFPDKNLISVDFFDLQGEYDIIIEQTFFCALSPKLREKYIQKMHSLLNKNGKLVGLLFDIPLQTEQPPYGGNKNDYLPLFNNFFNIKTMEKSYNSIKPRMGNELFINLEKK